jgi:hypothetical protein
MDLGDPDLSASLGHIAAACPGGHDPDPDATSSFVGAPTSSGGRFQVLRSDFKTRCCRDQDHQCGWHR